VSAAAALVKTMPHYFFDLTNGDSVADEVGEEFDGVERAYPFPLSMAVRAIAASENQMNQPIKCTLDCAADWGRCASSLLSSVMSLNAFCESPRDSAQDPSHV